ncbi:vacuolar protein sorting 55 [Rhizophagus irregularis]|uniref:Vacuolar protein sorting 55 n=2 Tax=Rhizophagus irregularis TaxID=588596 RepID=U9UYB4_RHIID|nr:vacuolar protein sorting 55 [Rhizophagus irregularis DAOM 181602=DAOM 197198]PKC08936.1 vacuolar protein sorting 55 [Rhizophagus irregularis]PKC70576.1 vacuolar protein sorting 55 [Rhizophagus irregularis]PKK63156.1 vacuolar protein sorting 55 [Rhizophagus irregularis]PKY17281.1 vacuolar protein sorting 55 [Rhizophagus irregularis]PKY50715.1 vacuolar protein sorting 55 [Rhizophagus irregularis]|eukprot:XP_025190136.1 vacuolar protein sorting 55 [Rhizophagus irregularis DAOM 181602=DAOM 197198]
MAGLKRIIGLSFILAWGFLLVILSGALYQNWWPLFVVATFVLAPLPNFIFSKCASGDDLYYFNEQSNNGPKDFGKFLTSILVVSGIALPIILAHIEVIEFAAMLMSVSGGFLVYFTILAYSYFFSEENEY